MDIFCSHTVGLYLFACTEKLLLKIHTVLFGGEYDLIFLVTKYAAVNLFHQNKIELIIFSVRKQQLGL